MTLAETAEICLQVAGDPLEVRLYLIDRLGEKPRPIRIAFDPFDLALLAGREQILNKYGRGTNAELVASGAAMFTALRPGKVGPKWKKLQQRCEADLCTYLSVEPPDLAKLPWELITDGLLPVVVAAPIIRTSDCIPPPDDLNPVRIPPSDDFKPVWPVRVFIVNAGDPNDHDIQAEQEIWAIRQALRKAEHSFDLEVYDVATAGPTFTLNTLIDAIKQRWPRGPHILHFIGHSVAEPEPALRYYVPSLDLYREWGLAMIAAATKQLPDLRVVFVNSCRSQEGGPNSATPWSVADALLTGAVAVIAMQADISGHAAVVCAGGFYNALSSGKSVDLALLEARKALLGARGEKDRELYAPVLTTRVAARDILPMRSFGWDEEKHVAWQNLLKENWTHFVNQHPHRRKLYKALFEPGATQNGLVVCGDNSVGKTWLVKWSAYAMALNGLQTHYLSMDKPKAFPADKPMDWLELLRDLRNGRGTLLRPGLEPELRSEFNWKLRHLAQGQPPPPYPTGQVVDEEEGSHPEIVQRGRLVNGFSALVCEAMVYALQQQASKTRLVLVLDNLSLPVVANLKTAFLDSLVGRAAVEGIRVILCCDNKLWDSYQAHLLDFFAWPQLQISEIDQRQVGGLIRELLRLQCPDSETTKAHQLATLEKFLKESPQKSMKAADLYITSSVLCRTFLNV
jgi:hypothetical protein